MLFTCGPFKGICMLFSFKYCNRNRLMCILKTVNVIIDDHSYYSFQTQSSVVTQPCFWDTSYFLKGTSLLAKRASRLNIYTRCFLAPFLMSVDFMSQLFSRGESLKSIQLRLPVQQLTARPHPCSNLTHKSHFPFSKSQLIKPDTINPLL